MKVCRRCGENKDLSKYYVHSGMSDGYLNICKTCTKVRVTAHRESNLDTIRAYDRSRGCRQTKEDLQKYRCDNPQKDKAHAMCARAIKTHKLIKCECMFDCIGKVEGHHNDYSRPLSVVWLCPHHHKRYHKYKNDFGISFMLYLNIFLD